MNLKRCENGHFYDAEKFQNCPHCASIGGDMNATQPYSAPMEEPVTMPLQSYGQAGAGMQQQGQVTAAPQMQSVPQMNGTQMDYGMPQMQEGLSLKDAVGRAVNTPILDDDDDDGKTVSLYQKKIGIEPVVGWLVCIEGNAFGESFKLKSGRNFIGRAAGMDVVIPGDESISREKHAIILYEPRKRDFIAQAGESRELFYLNDDVVLNPMRLKANDIVTIGNTRLMFFPCCGENFSWDDYKKDGE